jgi:L-ascorbate metabolism protein UlaG (beta-lactamase superfamily)
MRNLQNIDIAFVCMNLPYTMDINQAASAVLEFQPKIVYPFHYRGQDGFSDVEAFKKLVNAKNKTIEVRLKNWYPTN